MQPEGSLSTVLVPILSQINPVHALPFHAVRPSLIFSDLSLGLSSGLFPSGCPSNNPTRIFPYSRTSLRPPTKIKLPNYLSAVHTVHRAHNYPPSPNQRLMHRCSYTKIHCLTSSVSYRNTQTTPQPRNHSSINCATLIIFNSNVF